MFYFKSHSRHVSLLAFVAFTVGLGLAAGGCNKHSPEAKTTTNSLEVASASMLTAHFLRSEVGSWRNRGETTYASVFCLRNNSPQQTNVSLVGVSCSCFEPKFDGEVLDSVGLPLGPYSEGELRFAVPLPLDAGAKRYDCRLRSANDKAELTCSVTTWLHEDFNLRPTCVSPKCVREDQWQSEVELSVRLRQRVDESQIRFSTVNDASVFSIEVLGVREPVEEAPGIYTLVFDALIRGSRPLVENKLCLQVVALHQDKPIAVKSLCVSKL